MTDKDYGEVVIFVCLECGRHCATPQEASNCRRSDKFNEACQRIVSGEDPNWVEHEAAEDVEYDGEECEISTDPENPTSEQELNVIFYTETGKYRRTLVWRKKNEVRR